MGAIKKLPSVLISLFISFLIVYVILTVLASMIGGVNTSPIQDLLQSLVGNIANQIPEGISVTYWVIALLVLFAVAKAVPDKLKGVIMAITLIVLVTPVILRYSPFIENTESTINRVINHGDWSTASDYVQRIDGGTLIVNPGEAKIADVSRRVRIPIPGCHYLAISPGDRFITTWNDEVTIAFIKPVANNIERVTVTALPLSRC